MCGNTVWKSCVEALYRNLVWKSCLETMYRNQWAKKNAWKSCTEIVFEFVGNRGTDFQELGGTGWRIDGGTGGSGLLYRLIKKLITPA